jgi:hypothetical protein
MLYVARGVALVLVMVKVELADPPSVTFTVAGAKLQVAPVGQVEPPVVYDKLTSPAKWLRLAIVTV